MSKSTRELRALILKSVSRPLNPSKPPAGPSLPSQRLARYHAISSQLSTRKPPPKSRPQPENKRRYVASATFASGIITAAVLLSQQFVQDGELRDEEVEASTPLVKHIRLAEVKSHDCHAPQKWVIHGSRVYDITDWIPAHPGGDVIMRAAGSNVDPYWDIFSIHKTKDVYDILETYYIGDLDPCDLVDGKVPGDHVEDPFVNDPIRDERLIVHTERPFNAEAPIESLGTFITPNETFYVRQHLWVPECPDPDAHKLHIELPDGTEKDYTLGELKSKFDAVTITAALQCSGNRRKHLSEEARSASGLQWNIGAISNATWTGVRLRDVLADSGFDVNDYNPDDVKHVQFTGAEAYGSSIPIEKALSRTGDVLLVHAMNGAPIPPDHGYPLRLLAPGIVAARSVKWLSKIVLSDEESSSQWQQKDYKCFGPNVAAKEVDWNEAPAIQEMPVQSAITSLRQVSRPCALDINKSTTPRQSDDVVEVEGYAYSGAGRKIIRVDVSADDGRTWHQADLLPNPAQGSKSWSWTRWRWVLPREQAGKVFVCKAVDEGYNTQPEGYEATWNFRGNLTSAWHRVGFEGAKR